MPYTPPVDPMHEYSSREIIRLAQEAMNSLGYECGTPDGISGKKTTTPRRAADGFLYQHALQNKHRKIKHKVMPVDRYKRCRLIQDQKFSSLYPKYYHCNSKDKMQ